MTRKSREFPETTSLRFSDLMLRYPGKLRFRVLDTTRNYRRTLANFFQNHKVPNFFFFGDSKSDFPAGRTHIYAVVITTETELAYTKIIHESYMGKIITTTGLRVWQNAPEKRSRNDRRKARCERRVLDGDLRCSKPRRASVSPKPVAGTRPETCVV